MLKIENLQAWYDKAKVLNNINLSVSSKEAVAVLGPNGAGKTTLLKAICGLVRTSGKILFDGLDISKLKTHERIRLGISICPEGRRLFPNLTVEDNLILALKSKDDDILNFIYSIFPKLKERKNQLVKTMSGGEQQMLAIARALIQKPKFLMLDEPSTGLAPKIIAEILEILKKIKDELNLALLLVEQNFRLAFEICEKIYIMSRGEIIKTGTPDTLANLEELYLI